MNHTLVLFDSEAAYTAQLSRILGSWHTLPFEIHAFTELEALRAHLMRRRASLLLVAEKDFSEAVPAECADMVLILREGIGKSDLTSYESVSKYQSSADLVREIMTYYMPSSQAQTAAALTVQTDIVGIFSPLGRCGRTLFASAYGLLRADRGPTLYICLDPYCGIASYEENSRMGTLSDLLYYAGEDEAQLLRRISDAVCSLRLLSYIPPVRTPQDICDMESDDFKRLLFIIVRFMSYETILLDFGPAVPSPLTLMAACSRLYMPVLHDTVSERKTAAFRTMLAQSGREDLLSTISEIDVPPFVPADTGEGFAESLLLSPIGMQAMKILTEET